MRIVIDLQGAQTESRVRGIGRYSTALAQAIARNAGEHEVWIVLNSHFPEAMADIRTAFSGLIPEERIVVFDLPASLSWEEASNSWRRRAAELMRERFIAELQPDIVHVSSLFEGASLCDAALSVSVSGARVPTAVTLYDLIPLLDPDNYLGNARVKSWYMDKIENLKRADLLLSISEYSRQEAIEVLGIDGNRIVNVSTAHTDIFRPCDEDAASKQARLARFGITLPYVIYNGALESRKNLDKLLIGFSKLPPELRLSHQLVFAGKVSGFDRDRLGRLAATLGIGRQLVLTGYVSDEDLVALFTHCKLFVFPSLREGFGLPALEAMACGAAAIGSNVTSIPEVIGRADALFDPRNPDEIANKIAQVLSDEGYQRSLRDHALVQAAKFSWDNCGKAAIAAFERAQLDRPSPQPESWPEVEALRERSYRQLIDEIAAIPRGPAGPSERDLIAVAHCIANNRRTTERLARARAGQRQLLVDISTLVQVDAKSGIQRVVRSILRHWLTNPPPGWVVEPVYARTDALGYHYARNFTSRFLGEGDGAAADELVQVLRGDVFVGLDLQHHVAMHQQDVLSDFRRRGVKVFFVVYDLLPIRMPDFFRDWMRGLHQEWLETITRFDGAICISQAVAGDLTAWMNELRPGQSRSCEVSWFHLGADTENSVPTRGMPGDAQTLLAALKTRPSFLSVGTIEPRKGQAQLLGAIEALWAQGHDINLVLVGQEGWKVDGLVKRLRSHSELGKRLFWLEGASDEYLEKVYGASSCLVAASEGEGFGLPLIEAAQHGLPVLARDLPVFREVAGAHAFYFKNDNNPQVLADAIREWLALDQAGSAPQSRDMPWLTWAQSAAQLSSIVVSNNSSGKEMV